MIRHRLPRLRRPAPGKSGLGTCSPGIRGLGIFALVLLALTACRTPRGVGEPEPHTPEGRGQDAQSLGAFDIPAEEATPAAEVERFKVAIGDAPVRGPADAPVTVVVFYDFECPFCLKAHLTMERLREDFPSKLRVAYKAYPLDFHGHALLAAMVARSAQAGGKFWEFHDRLFAEQGIDVARLVREAEAVGLDVGKVRQEIETLEYGPEVRRDIRQARRLGVDSTPTFFINGRVISGAQPYEAFAFIVQQELELAAEYRKEGVPADGLYAHATRDGYDRVKVRGRGLDPDGVYEVPLGDSPRLGPDDAPVTIVEFGDFECPFCVKGNRTVQAMKERYGDDIRIVYKHNPLSFHSRAFVAARASVAAHRQGKFWAFHDALYDQGAKIEKGTLDAVAKRAGLDMKKFQRAMNDPALDEQIQADLELGAQLGVTGTPAFFVNGRPIEGALPELQFRLLIEEELDRAREAVASGIAPADIYETLSHQPLP